MVTPGQYAGIVPVERGIDLSPLLFQWDFDTKQPGQILKVRTVHAYCARVITALFL